MKCSHRDDYIAYIYTNKYRYKGKYTSFYASRIHLPGCPALRLLLLLLLLLLYFPLDSEYFCCFFPFLPLPALLGSLLSLQHFNIAATRQNVNVVHVYFLLLLCTFSCIFITRRQLVACLGAGPVPRCAAQCAATFTAHFGVCLSAAAAALGKRLSSKSCVASGVARTQKDPESVSENIKTPHWRLLSTKWC